MLKIRVRQGDILIVSLVHDKNNKKRMAMSKLMLLKFQMCRRYQCKGSHLDCLAAAIDSVPIQQALFHRHPVSEVLAGNDPVDGLCQVDVPGDVWQALQLGGKVFELSQAAL